MFFPTIRILFGLLLCFGVYRNMPAQNLIANSGFEDENICTELDAPCAPEAWKEVNFERTYFVQNDKGGKVGIRVSNNRFMRSFLFTELLCPLEAGETYQIDFDLNLRGNTFVPFGMFFSDQDFSSHFNPKLADSVVVFSEANALQKIKKMDWVPFRTTFRAKGGERFLYIGYFEKSLDQHNWMYVIYLDNIELSPLNPGMLCPEAETKRAELYANNRRHWEYSDEMEPEASQQPWTPDAPEEEEPEDLPEKLYQPDTLLLSGVCFDFDKSTLNAHYAAVTDSLIDRVMARNPESVHISGHTDNIGTDDFNGKLSLARAQTIGGLFVQKGLSPEKITCDGKGETQPTATNDTETGRAANRRIELILLFKN
jgi:outer membrane protein OmpA-like peptidoglycan-associated protein